MLAVSISDVNSEKKINWLYLCVTNVVVQFNLLHLHTVAYSYNYS